MVKNHRFLNLPKYTFEACLTFGANNSVSLYSATDYYPFGMEMPQKNWVYRKYRFGYQGQFAEKDEETGYTQFEARLWDAGIARWLTTDPAGQYWSPYLGMGNNPINGVDPDGRNFVGKDKNGNLILESGDTPIDLMKYVNSNNGNITLDQAYDLYYNQSKGDWLCEYYSNASIDFSTMYKVDSHFANMHLSIVAQSARQSMNNVGYHIGVVSSITGAFALNPIGFSSEYLAQLYINDGNFMDALNNMNMVNALDPTGFAGAIINVNRNDGFKFAKAEDIPANLACSAFTSGRGKGLALIMKENNVPTLLIKKTELLSGFISTSSTHHVEFK